MECVFHPSCFWSCSLAAKVLLLKVCGGLFLSKKNHIWVGSSVGRHPYDKKSPPQTFNRRILQSVWLIPSQSNLGARYRALQNYSYFFALIRKKERKKACPPFQTLCIIATHVDRRVWLLIHTSTLPQTTATTRDTKGTRYWYVRILMVLIPAFI